MTDPPAVGVGGWHADPTGRHELRWWDGDRFTADVADGGLLSTDDDVASEPPRPPRRRLRLVIALVGGVAVLVGAAGAAVVLTHETPSGFGVFAGEVAGDEGAGQHRVSIPAGSAVIVDVEPSADLDAVVGLVVDDETADRLQGLFEDMDLEFLFGPIDFEAAFDGNEPEAGDVDDDLVVFFFDGDFAGRPEQAVLFTPIAIDGTVVVAGADDTAGDYAVSIQRIAIAVDERADGDELLAAVLADERVPASFRQSIEELLAIVDE